MTPPLRFWLRSGFLCALAVSLSAPAFSGDYLPGKRVLLDAHNCYPYQGKWADRIDRALSAGTPLAIEQDLIWVTDPATGKGHSIVAHGKPYIGTEPSMKDHFFEKVRPIVEKALASGDKSNWPLITLNLDFKDSGREHCEAIWAMLGEYEAWLCTAPKTDTIEKVEPLDLKPILVLTAGGGNQNTIFYNEVATGAKLRLFACGEVRPRPPGLAPGQVPTAAETVSAPANNYRRWWNNSWRAIEPEGQPRAAEFTDAERARLADFTAQAHKLGYWIRFYTLDGCTPDEAKTNGWGGEYNFGTPEAMRIRWQACKAAGVDFIASDQYEELGAALAGK